MEKADSAKPLPTSSAVSQEEGGARTIHMERSRDGSVITVPSAKEATASLACPEVVACVVQPTCAVGLPPPSA
eukprot:3697131-Amphidinium_carterae.1